MDKTEDGIKTIHSGWFNMESLCGVEALGICRHLDFNTVNALKYLLRKDKEDGNKTIVEKRIEDLRKVVFYINDEIERIRRYGFEKNEA